jgi:hypothetical protein
MSSPTVTKEVEQIGQINFTGNITPGSWYEHLRRPNGKPYTIAIVLLGEIVYWYRPTEIRDEATGKIVGLRKKFKADLVQRSYGSFVEQFGFTKRQVKAALKFLEEQGVISLNFRHITIQDGRKLPNVLFIGIYPARVREITHTRASDMLQNNVTYPTPEGETNTETTTEITTETTTKGNGADAPKRKPTGRNAIKAELETHFVEVTELERPPTETKAQGRAYGKLWGNPLLEIHNACADLDGAKRLITWTIGKMDQDKLPVCNPNSILKIALAEAAKRKRNGNDQRRANTNDH